MSESVKYIITDWATIYENHRSRKCKEMSWVPTPVKLYGDGYVQMMENDDGTKRKDGPAIFGCFAAIIQVAAKAHPRGSLVRRDGTPHNALSLSRITRMPAELIERTLQFCINPLKWIETEGCAECAPTTHPGAPIAPSTVQYTTRQDNTGREECLQKCNEILSEVGLHIVVRGTFLESLIKKWDKHTTEKICLIATDKFRQSSIFQKKTTEGTKLEALAWFVAGTQPGKKGTDRGYLLPHKQ